MLFLFNPKPQKEVTMNQSLEKRKEETMNQSLEKIMRSSGLRAIIFISALLILGLWSANGICKEPIKIAIIRDLTGPGSEAGRPQAGALKMVFDEVNAKGGIKGHQIVYEVADGQCDPNRAASLAKRYIDVYNAILLAGETCSGACIGLMNIAVEHETPALGHGFALKLYEGEIGKWFFGSSANNDEMIKSMLHVARKDGIKKIAVIWTDNAWARDGKEATYKFAKEYGLTIVGDAPVEAATPEATTAVLKVKGMNPEAVVGILMAREMAAVARGFAAANWKLPTYSWGPLIEPAIKIAGADLMEGWKGAYLADPSDPKVVEVVNKYKAKYNDTPDSVNYFMETWEAARVLVHVLESMIEKGESLTRKNLRDAMEKYSAGVELLTPKPRKSKAWGKPPHILTRAEDTVSLVVKSGRLVKY
jgi:branched-chain amino acid transport system substrate-binding protein